MTPILYTNAKNISLINQLVYIHREVKTSISRSGKLSDFYYEQIESGNILLEFCKSNTLDKLYSYELSIYMRTILRIWCLIDRQSLDSKKVKEYKTKIEKYYKKYVKEYYERGLDKKYIKVLFMIFGISKKLWGNLLYKLYFERK